MPRGFSLVELAVAMGVFLVIGSVSLTLFEKHQTLLSREQGVAGLNIGLRNALSQLQLDVVNAGYGLNLGGVPAWPLGVTIVNSDPATPCNTAAVYNSAGVMTAQPTYSSTCFDQLNIIKVDQNTPALGVTNSCTSAVVAIPVAASSTSVVAGPVPSPYTPSGIIGNFKAGDQILFIHQATSPGPFSPPPCSPPGAHVTRRRAPRPATCN